ncbi:protein DEHYDRATION-INDUCED 19 homolog 5-like isoform X1 [Benincasa hispida]|uniref:protein DEHYDRATION-INDUCED 19 homolog 5-like isoform X1 n=1 Tax=Benincasa hispida TaxID=102211 RepID=UPI001902484B|nr:protein DEHYDRATION-INDUCED 19 homolog 5-like isoform X1 [Benincasa hispida]
MELNFWASRVHPTDQLSAVQAAMLHSGNHIILDDSDGEDDSRPYFSCPYCYVDIEVQVLCSHLQEEHCFDFRNAVCPLCAASLGKDVIGHFTAHHASSIKRRRKPEKSVSSIFNSKKLITKSSDKRNGSAPDPLLPFICSIPFSDPESVERDDRSENDASVAANVESNSSQLLERSQNSEELNQRASFVQQLITSTIF